MLWRKKDQKQASRCFLRRRRKGRKVSRAVRVVISMIPIVRRDEKLFGSRIPQSLFFEADLSSDGEERRRFFFFSGDYPEDGASCEPEDGENRNRLSPTPEIDHQGQQKRQNRPSPYLQKNYMFPWLLDVHPLLLVRLFPLHG
jgi:hypothetical protein